MSHTLVFDVNETLLDLSGLDRHFERIFGDKEIRDLWFSVVLRNALALTVIGRYRDFVTVGHASLQMVADVHQIELTAEDRAAISGAMANLPAHGDVAPNLQRLSDRDFRLVALTNSPPDAARDQLTNAGLAPFFGRIMSVAPTGKFKPAREVYEYAADKVGVRIGTMTMVAAHDWDIAGAMGAGMEGAFILRPGTARNPLYAEPEVVGTNLEEVADILIERHRP